MSRAPIPTWFFALTVVRRGDRFLLVQERRGDQRWYLPAGRVEPGERLEDGARREALEESGIPIVLEGLLRVEHTPHPNGSARCRVFFQARPADDRPPKDWPDQHSLRAAWVTLEALHGYPLRGAEVREVLEYVAGGGAVYPLTLLQLEGAPWPDLPDEREIE